MVGANKFSRVIAILVTHEVRAMAATIVEDTNFVIRSADHDQRLLADPTTNVVTALWDLAFVPNIQPHLLPNLAQLLLKKPLIVVKTSMNAIRQYQ